MMALMVVAAAAVAQDQAAAQVPPDIILQVAHTVDLVVAQGHLLDSMVVQGYLLAVAEEAAVVEQVAEEAAEVALVYLVLVQQVQAVLVLGLGQLILCLKVAVVALVDNQELLLMELQAVQAAIMEVAGDLAVGVFCLLEAPVHQAH